MEELKIGDEVIINGTLYNLQNEEGVIVAIDRDGDYLVKTKNVINSYDYCIFNKYHSNRRDLVIASGKQIKLKK